MTIAALVDAVEAIDAFCSGGDERFAHALESVHESEVDGRHLRPGLSSVGRCVDGPVKAADESHVLVDKADALESRPLWATGRHGERVPVLPLIGGLRDAIDAVL